MKLLTQEEVNKLPANTSVFVVWSVTANPQRCLSLEGNRVIANSIADIQIIVDAGKEPYNTKVILLDEDEEANAILDKIKDFVKSQVPTY